MGFEDYEGGIYGEKVLLHAKIQEVYMSDKLAFIKGGYYVKVSSSEGKNMLWEMVDELSVSGIR